MNNKKIGEDNSSRSNFFTLIELLVVIAIISILMSMLFPMLRQVREKSIDAKCQNTLRQWYVLLNYYENDNKGWFPGIVSKPGDVWVLGTGDISAFQPDYQIRSLVIRKYLLSKSEALGLACPGSLNVLYWQWATKSPTYNPYEHWGTLTAIWDHGFHGYELGLGATQTLRHKYGCPKIDPHRQPRDIDPPSVWLMWDSGYAKYADNTRWGTFPPRHNHGTEMGKMITNVLHLGGNIEKHPYLGDVGCCPRFIFYDKYYGDR